MIRTVLPRRAHRLAAAVLVLMVAGCGGEAGVEVRIPGGGAGPRVAGVVELPNGELRADGHSLWQRFAQALMHRAQALVAGTVRPVGAGVAVELVRIGPENIADGEIQGGQVVVNAATNEFGQYELHLPKDTDANTCRFYVRVGRQEDGTLTRAFVFSTSESVDINFESEAAVRLILAAIEDGEAGLCDFDAGEIGEILAAITSADTAVVGATIEELNAAAHMAAELDPDVQAALRAAISEPTATPPQPSSTRTRTPTRTPSGEATATPTSTATATASAVTTSTESPTATNTPRSPTAPPPTHTPPRPTNTPVPATPTPTVTRTNTAPPSATRTPTTRATATATRTRTATLTPTVAVPEIDLGLVAGTTGVFAGTAGATLSIPVSLTSHGVPVAAVSNDIEFDGTHVDVATVDGAPDCNIEGDLVETKRVVAKLTSLNGGRKRLRVGVVGSDNNAALPDGPLYRCRFAVAADAPAGSVPLTNVPDASDPLGRRLEAVGNAGRIRIAAGGPALGLSAGTAAAGETVPITASLRTAGKALAAVATEIRFETSLVRAADENSDGEPDCAADPSIGGGTEFNKLVFAIVHEGEQAGTQVLRVGLVAPDNNTALPATSAVFQCNFVVEAAGGTIPLRHTPDGSDPSGQAVGLRGEPGQIAVE